MTTDDVYDDDLDDIDEEDATPAGNRDPDFVNKLRRKVKELERFKAETERQKRADTFRAVGFDPEGKRAQAILKLIDGDPTPDAVAKVVSEYGFQPDLNPPGQGQPDADLEPAPAQIAPEVAEVLARQDRAARVFNEGRPADARTKVSMAEWNELIAKGNSDQATKLLQQGLVDFPPHVAEAMEVNRNTPILGR